MDRLRVGRSARRTLFGALAATVATLTFGGLAPVPAGLGAGNGAEAGAATIPGSSADTTFPAGSLIVDLGIVTGNAEYQTKDEALKPYGFVFELLVNRKIPVSWIIANGKVAGNPPATGKSDDVDFSTSVAPNGSGGPVTKSYKGSAFVVSQRYLSDLPLATLTTWRDQGVVIDVAESAFVAPEFTVLRSWPKAILDAENGDLAIPYYQNAGIPASITPAVPAGAGVFESWAFKSPDDLNPCDDIYIMPHADPTWATHQNLLAFNNAGGAIWAGCHAISVLESLDGDSDGEPDLNFLSTNGLLDFESHSDGSTPYAYSEDGSDPILQFLGVLDVATENGSEQIFMPKPGSAWRPTTKVLVWDPTQADVPENSPGEAAVLAYGRGFGQESNGVVMYEGGHSLDDNNTGAGAAQRAFLNQHLLAGYERAPDLQVDVPASAASGAQVTVDATITGGSAPYDYQWESSCGGTFDTAAGTRNAEGTFSTTFTAPAVVNPSDCNIRVLVTDGCGRGTFGIDQLSATPPEAPVARHDEFVTPFETDLSETVVVNDTYPPGAAFTVTTPPPGVDGSVTLDPDGSFVFSPAPGFTGTTTFDYELCLAAPYDSLCDSAVVTIVVGPAAVDDSYAAAFDTDVTDTVASNDTAPPSATFALMSPPPGTEGTLTLDPDGSFVFDPAPTFTGTTTFAYEVCLAAPNEAVCDQATATIAIGPEAIDDTYDLSPTSGSVDGDLGPNDQYPLNATFTLVTPPVNGAVQLDPAGTFTYVPNPGFTGTDAFTYDVCFPVPPGDPALPADLCSQAVASLQVTPTADLGVTKTHVGPLVAGSMVTYTIDATNDGPSNVTGARIVDELPANLLDAAWTCDAAGGAVCPAAWGIGAPDLTVDIPNGGSVQVALTATVQGESGDVVNTVRITPPPGVVDPNPANDVAIDGAPIEGAPASVLAMTGSSTRVWAGLGVALLGLGLALSMIARRARRRTA